MTTPNTPMVISPFAQKQAVKYLEGVLGLVQQDNTFRSRLLEQDRIYYRENDYTASHLRGQQANRAGDAKKMANVQVPVVGPQVDSARAYFVELFLNSYPIFPVVADPARINVAQQIEALLGHSAIFFQWGRHFALCFLDGLKYNIQAMECEWVTQKVPSVVNDASQDVNMGVPKEVEFQGNKLRRINPYNLIFDQRVPVTEVHTRGEFVGYSDLITRIELKQLFLDLDTTRTMNATDAFKSGRAATTHDISQVGSYYVPQVNPNTFISSTYTAQNWLQWANLDTQKKIQYSDMYEKTVIYARVIPKELGIFAKTGRKNAGDPQIYKFIFINRKVLVYVERMTNAHNMLPIVIGQMNEDGLGLQTKSYADNAAPYQALATALYNSGLESQRRKVYDRIFYDPSRINKRDIDNVDPVARIPIKNEAYGKPVSEAYSQVPYRDEGVASIIAMGREMVDMADISTGSNRIQRGQFQKGNKTRFEVEQTMGNSDARPKTSAILLEISWFQPLKDILKYNILQYQPPAELFSRDAQTTIKVDPVSIRSAAWEFQLADGMMPSDKFLDFNLFGQVLQYAGMNPVAMQDWDLGGMFAYQLKAQGARWVDSFKRTPEQQARFLAQTQAQNNPPQLPAPGAQ